MSTTKPAELFFWRSFFICLEVQFSLRKGWVKLARSSGSSSKWKDIQVARLHWRRFVVKQSNNKLQCVCIDQLATNWIHKRENDISWKKGGERSLCKNFATIESLEYSAEMLRMPLKKKKIKLNVFFSTSARSTWAPSCGRLSVLCLLASLDNVILIKSIISQKTYFSFQMSKP